MDLLFILIPTATVAFLAGMATQYRLERINPWRQR